MQTFDLKGFLAALKKKRRRRKDIKSIYDFEVMKVEKQSRFTVLFFCYFHPLFLYEECLHKKVL